MDKKEIQSFSLSRLLEDHELRPGDLYYDGCLIASRVDSQCDIHTDLFSYPVRMDAIALVFCSKGSITLTSNYSSSRRHPSNPHSGKDTDPIHP